MNYVTDISRKSIYTLSSSTMNWWKICYHFFRVIDIMRNNVISKKFKAKFKLDYLEICKYAQICFSHLFTILQNINIEFTKLIQICNLYLMFTYLCYVVDMKNEVHIKYVE